MQETQGIRDNDDRVSFQRCAANSVLALVLIVMTFTSTLVNAHLSKSESKGQKGAPPKVIYGVDTRHDAYAEPDSAMRAVSLSTVALLHRDQLSGQNDGNFFIHQVPFGTSHLLCPAEKFYSQGSAAFCSGFLVGDNFVITAGHCIATAQDCQRTTFIFDYAYASETEAPSLLQQDDVYTCDKIIHTQQNGTGADFAVVQLDRPVKGHPGLPLRTSGSVAIGDAVFVAGYPSGLALKIANGAQVRHTDANFFTANLDTYAGNSGSAVFNQRSLQVEGVLVRGERDFVPTSNNCLASNVCASDACRGEDVTKISEILPYLPNLMRVRGRWQDRSMDTP